MKRLLISSSAVISLASGVLSTPLASRSDLILFKPLSVTKDSVHNIHVEYGDSEFEGEVRVVSLT